MNAHRRTTPASLAASLTLMLSFLSATLAPAVWAAWPPANLQVSPDVVAHLHSASAPDGSGGEIVVFEEDYRGTTDLFAIHVASDGTLPWGSGGKPICQAAGSQRLAVIVSDGAGGA